MPKYPSEPDLADLIRGIYDRLENLERANPFINAGIPEGGLDFYGGGSARFHDGGGIVVDTNGVFKTSDFDGANSASPGTKGVYIASEAGVGKMVINDLVLRGGIIGNDALTSPVTLGSNGQVAGNFALSTSATTVVSQTIAIPAGYTKAVMIATGGITAIESAGTPDYLNFTVLINGTGSANLFSLAAANQDAHVSNSSVRSLTGLSPGSITFTGTARTNGHNWTAQSANICTINAIALFLR